MPETYFVHMFHDEFILNMPASEGGLLQITRTSRFCKYFSYKLQTNSSKERKLTKFVGIIGELFFAFSLHFEMFYYFLKKDKIANDVI